jgi:hypothetical protein
MSSSSSPGYSTIHNLRSLNTTQLDDAYDDAFKNNGGARIPSDQMSAFILEYGRRDAELTNHTLKRINYGMFGMTVAITVMTLIILITSFFGR